ncbi:hypothetical protein [Rubrimonas cliftonensis]|uniref:Outer membrane protein beta-barrel domain-containing protein n=1 Tax=Rubrimonas cliftonensis TaxID=89524 RepID=A0A1H4B926_9RHOB|nr:hypothetical protein [Rubrimonas cliftonensis]SEA44627.1 hypothetical protein SAMN05444370_10583 [Rubrimonas cliftonensis]
MTRHGCILAVLLPLAAALAPVAASAQIFGGASAFPLDTPDAPLVSLCAAECEPSGAGSPVTVTVGGETSRVDVTRFTPNPRFGGSETGAIGAAASAYGFDFGGAFHKADESHDDRVSFGAAFVRGALRFGGGLSFGVGPAEDQPGAASLGLGVALAPGLSVDGGVAFSETPQGEARETDVEYGVRMRFDF